MKHGGLVSLAFAIVAFGAFKIAMDYPWQLAVLAATAIGALVYSTQSTWKRMRRLHRPPQASDLVIDGRGAWRTEDPLRREAAESGLVVGVASRGRLTPGEDAQSEREQQVQPSTEDEPRHEQDQPTGT